MSTSKFIDSYPWLTNKLFESILHTSEDLLNSRVIDFEVSDAIAKGENYGSKMLRVLVNYRVCENSGTQQKSYIIKTTFSGELKVLLDLDLTAKFVKELAFFREILPRLMKYTQSFDETFKFAPRCYDVNENPVYIVLEDLKPDDYRNFDRRTGLDFQATEMVLKKVARYHAMGAKLYAENSGKMFDVHKISILNSPSAQLVEMFMCGMKECQELSRYWPGYEHLSSKFEKLNTNFFARVQTMFKTEKAEFNVVTHGDLWSNNFMFKFDEANKPIDVILVDFQTGFIGSPAIDLAYLLYISTANNIKEKEWDRLVQIYHAELITTLKAIGYPRRIPTLTEIQIQMLQRSLYAVMVFLTSIAPRHMMKTEHADLDIWMYDNEKAKRVRHEVYEKPEVKERLLYLLDYFERKGFLEID